ncbi:small GTP-binding protein, putative [Trichomonas vaginalis G3]|uniref:Small GTP-binding protein, putative n=1 Tax=Trichomonas vaginalis (strain ATCC PRA-98 / G3) TaxID=412133 RepID=A2F5C8_TRIV3|nr:GTP binding [Trichomonas vaginalis G3]EAX99891.1 small GTP-binding protein, putative [Trichomonas vaginalis G3]KAI5492929.1 GTP binding [Trichomonas vaginalis G3]|eukprot:XP_001312821.1 small GTP-binding protein [Trichomonas vaginalis G3]
MGCVQSEPDTILILGIGSAGKTTILFRLKTGQVQSTQPTVGFVAENIEIGGKEYLFWDLGGQDKMRPLWKHYFEGSSGVIFVVDSADTSNFQTAKEEIHEVAHAAQLRKVPIAVFANKQDIEGAANAERIASILELPLIGKDRCEIFETSALTGQGLDDGMKWLSAAIETSRK